MPLFAMPVKSLTKRTDNKKGFLLQPEQQNAKKGNDIFFRFSMQLLDNNMDFRLKWSAEGNINQREEKEEAKQIGEQGSKRAGA